MGFRSEMLVHHDMYTMGTHLLIFPMMLKAAQSAHIVTIGMSTGVF